MKHFLKPLGHCLTTAVMTSAMLRLYALPAVEAATPEPETTPPSTGEAANFNSAESLPSPDLTVSPPEATRPEVAPLPEVTPPELVPQESAPAPISEAAPAQTVEQPALTAPVPTAPEASGIEKPSGTSPIPTDPKPSANPPTEAADKPGNAPDSATPSPSSPKAEANSRPQTIAGMRQVLEKRLADIVEHDKPTREAQWQQNVIYTALQAAWKSEFARARQIAKHPALPSDVQTELLGKIAAIELQLSPQTAQQPSSATQPHSAQGNQPGRTVPSGYAGVNVGALSSYAGISLAKQCPAVNRATPPKAAQTATASASQATANSGNSSRQKPDFPDFVPALGQNLASRLAQLSQKPINLAKAPAGVSRQPVVAPHLFVGVASSSLKVQPQKLQPQKLEPQSDKPTPSVAPTTARTIPALPPAQLVQPVQPPSSSPTEVKAISAQLPSPRANPNADLGADLDSGADLNQSAPSASPSLDQIIGSTLNYSLAQLNIPFFQLPDPLNLAWNWWTAPSDSEKLSVSLPTRTDGNQADSSTFKPLAPSVEIGLGSPPLWQTVEQQLASLQPLRNARKLSIPSVSLATTSKPPVYDATALLEMSCGNAQLAHYEAGTYIVDPATSKRMGWVNLMFPLPIPAAITSAFGWRIHPISGNLSFHTGLDLGAPMGTPVMAALGGRVVAADYMGGYGLAVIVENPTTHQRNLYGHLSGIAVQPGMQVAQGAILGWVGSTGNSTGPHLHFESMIATENGWTAIDPLASAAVSVARGRE
jgi:murein DD-endopeptidase MepM/ murein hydrolase activator NlpD